MAMHVLLSVKCLAAMFLANLSHVSGAMPCQDTLDCARMNLGGYTCQNLRCVCDPNTDTGLFPCRSKNIDLTGRTFGDKCRADYECPEELNLVCARIELRTCRCRRGYMWNVMTKTCYMIDDQPYDNGNKGFDPVREIIVPGIVIMTIGTLIYVGIKVFCNCGKFWRRRGRQLNRELDDGSHQQATWVASYRVFSSLNGMETRSSPALSPSSSFPLHPTPCMGLFLPSGSLATTSATASTTSPPPYEEALKHKVILSSFPSATTVILHTAPPIQGPLNNLPAHFMCSNPVPPN
ncbi:uncharacterized protein LOC110832147 isoform X2 [Zootermopsis nevadensis]|uniref:uncharacterized protein LOC110832147 isoform X2 n=1 Tax=Zootermopsis nevadensis TaxID=136037 RepID=UPI000B8ED982|nr:uncharacterized protein LOC110832147 isoform X2 [Zootermopsis nevadensis]